MDTKTYTRVAATLEAALHSARAKFPPQAGKDYTVSKITSWDMEFGSLMQQTRLWFEIAKDPDRMLRPSSDRVQN